MPIQDLSVLKLLQSSEPIRRLRPLLVALEPLQVGLRATIHRASQKLEVPLGVLLVGLQDLGGGDLKSPYFVGCQM